jgi:hypothetical protein
MYYPEICYITFVNVKQYIGIDLFVCMLKVISNLRTTFFSRTVYEIFY